VVAHRALVASSQAAVDGRTTQPSSGSHSPVKHCPLQSSDAPPHVAAA
jgi:hypothetical protein